MSELIPDQPTQITEFSDQNNTETFHQPTFEEMTLSKSSLPWKAIGAGAAVLALGAGAFMAGKSSEGGGQAISSTDTTTTIELIPDEPITETTSVPSTTIAPSSPMEQEFSEYPIERPSRLRAIEERKPTDSEIVTVNDLELALPEGEDVDSILRALAFNKEQIANYVQYLNDSEQNVKNNEFLSYVVIRPAGDLGNQYLEAWNKMQDFRQRDIFHDVYEEYTDINVLEQSSDSIEVEATLVTTMSSGERLATRKLLSLNTSEVSTQFGPRMLWVLSAERILQNPA